MKARIGILAGLLAFCAGTIFAAEGRKEIFGPVVLSGSGIDGRYFVSRNITSATQNIIDITGTGVENVEIDLNGFTLSCASGFFPIKAQEVRRLIIRNGSVRVNGGTPGDVGIRVDDLGAVNAGDQVIVENVQISGGDDGILINGITNVELRDNVCVNCNLLVDVPSVGGQPKASGTIADNTLINGGIAVLDSSGFEIRGNEVRNATSAINVLDSPGVVIADNLCVDGHILIENSPNGRILNNSVTGADAEGIFVRTSNGFAVKGNSVNGAGADGIRVLSSAGGSIAENTVSGSSGEGLHLVGSSRNHIESNTAHDNTGFGIRLNPGGSNNRIGRNSAVGNGGAGCTTAIPPACPTTADFCDEGTGDISFGDNLLPGLPPC